MTACGRHLSRGEARITAKEAKVAMDTLGKTGNLAGSLLRANDEFWKGVQQRRAQQEAWDAAAAAQSQTDALNLRIAQLELALADRDDAIEEWREVCDKLKAAYDHLWEGWADGYANAQAAKEVFSRLNEEFLARAPHLAQEIEGLRLAGEAGTTAAGTPIRKANAQVRARTPELRARIKKGEHPDF